VDVCVSVDVDVSVLLDDVPEVAVTVRVPVAVEVDVLDEVDELVWSGVPTSDGTKVILEVEDDV